MLKHPGRGVKFRVLNAAVVDAAPGPSPNPFRLNAGARLLAALIGLACLGVLVIAASLPPRADGFGTHLALGLPECGFLQRTGLPCPACGMTTSFAWFVRGNVAASLYVQPMGTALAALCGLTVWAGAYIAITGRPLHWLIATAPPRYFAGPLLVLAVMAWGWKIFIHLHGIDGWR
jgi:hypothetical protein